MKTHFFVTNMQCAGCAARVRESVRSFRGVVAVEVNVDARLVAVEYHHDAVDTVALRQLLTASGFKLSAFPIDTGDSESRMPVEHRGPSLKRLVGRCLFHVCNQFPVSKAWLGRWGLRTQKEWFANRTARIQLPDGQHLKLASVGENYLSFQLFWRGTQFYEPITTLVLQELLRPGDTFLDVGANIGFYSLVLTLTHPGLRVVAFEPNPKVHALLRRNVSANRFHQITCEAPALSDAEGTAPLYLSRSDHSASLRSDFEGRFLSSVVVPTLTLDGYFSALKRVPLDGRLVIKIDAEDNEDAVLRGARTTLSTLRPDIIVEAARSRQDAPLPWLKELGYRLYSITDRGLDETSTWAPVVRSPYVFLNGLLTTRPPTEVSSLFDRIQDRVRRIDLSKTSKLADPMVLQRAAGKLT